jgi:hypothetical protein
MAANTMESIACLQRRSDALAPIVVHIMAKHDVHRALRLVTLALRWRKIEALCALCSEMAREGHVTQIATLLAEAAR